MAKSDENAFTRLTMEYAISLLPWLIPCLGACLTTALPSNLPARVRRWVQMAVLLGTCIALALVQGATLATWNPPNPLLEQFEAPTFSYDHPGITLAWLPLGLFTLVNLGLTMKPLEGPESARQLALLGMATATMAASTPFTLALMWGLTDLVLLVLKVRRTREEPYLLMRHGATNLLSVMALVVAVALMGGRENGLFADAFDGAPRIWRAWLVLAALFRLGVYPLPHRHGEVWEMDVVSVYTGIYLWIQIGTSQPLVGLLVPFISLSLLAMGLLANRATDFGHVWPYVSMYGILLTLFPILVGGDAGVAVTLSLAALWGLGLTLRHLYIRASVPREIVPWSRAPIVVALGALSGLPLTLGFTARWSLLALCWLHGRWGVILVVSAVSLLVSIPLWQQLEELLAFHGDYKKPEWPELIPIGAGALLAAALLIGGVWPGGGTMLSPLEGDMEHGDVLLLLVLIPPLGGYVLYTLWERLSLPIPSWNEGLAPLLRLEWLYGSAEMALERVDAWIAQLYTTLEDALGLGWILIWALALILYLVER